MKIRSYLNEISHDLYGCNFESKSLDYYQKSLILRTQEKFLLAISQAYDTACKWENPQ